MSFAPSAPLTLSDCLVAVAAFHRRIGAPVAAQPGLLPAVPAAAFSAAGRLRTLAADLAVASNPADLLGNRLALALEELAEWVEAHVRQDLVAAADAAGDRLYVLLGDAVATGLPLPAIFSEVHRSNLTKQAGAVGGGTKGLKGADYAPPRLGPPLFFGASAARP